MGNKTDLIVISGFGDKGVHELTQHLEELIEPKRTTIVKGCPWYRAMEHPETIIERIYQEIRTLSPEELIIVGHSYGALLALAVATRLEVENVLKQLILIDGPLNSYTDVAPAKLAHHIFYEQYRNRVKIALACEEALRQMDTTKITTICGQEDRIVPFEAKLLPRFQEVIVGEDEEGNPLVNNEITVTGRNLILRKTKKFRGHGLEQKIPDIVKIIAQL